MGTHTHARTHTHTHTHRVKRGIPEFRVLQACLKLKVPRSLSSSDIPLCQHIRLHHIFLENIGKYRFDYTVCYNIVIVRRLVRSYTIYGSFRSVRSNRFRQQEYQYHISDLSHIVTISTLQMYVSL